MQPTPKSTQPSIPPKFRQSAFACVKWQIVIPHYYYHYININIALYAELQRLQSRRRSVALRWATIRSYKTTYNI